MENIVYSTRTCPFCIMVKDLLRERGIEFEDRIIDSRAEVEELKKKYGWRTVPIVVLDGKFIGGFDETRKLADSGELTG